MVENSCVRKIAGCHSFLETLSLGASEYLGGKYRSTKDLRYLADRNKLRDEAMADNLSWQLSVLYPNRKIIIWAATAHLIRNQSSIRNRDDKSSYTHYKLMGSYVYKEFRNQMSKSLLLPIPARAGI